MSRCAICDYTETEGSQLMDKAPSANGVSYHTKTAEFLCDECSVTIKRTKQQLAELDVK